jgi:DNA invertase Pin-like site-specific DNA recombinase
MSPKQQDDVTLEALNLYRKIRPGWDSAIDDGFYFDEATSRTSKMVEREVGGLVLAATKPNDVIMAAKFDRIFANTIDACEVIELIEAKDFRLCILDLDIPLDNHIGQAVFKILAAIKEMEVKEIRQRAKDSSAYRRKVGLPNNGNAPIGWRVIDGTNDDRIYIEDGGARRLARKLLTLRNTDEYRFLSLAKFATAMNNRGLTHPSGAIWWAPTITRWLEAAKQDFPKRVHDFDSAALAVGSDHALA